MLLAEAIDKLKREQGITFVLKEDIYDIWKSDTQDGFVINKYQTENLSNVEPCDGGLCTGSEEDAVLFLINEDSRKYFQDKDIDRKEESIPVSTESLLDLILHRECFTINDGARLYNINSSAGEIREKSGDECIVDVVWEEDGEDCHLEVLIADVVNIYFNTKWLTYHIETKDDVIDLQILETTAVTPQSFNV